MKILIVGAGALGILFAGLMSRHGGDVVILTRRREAAETISSNGIIISDGKSSWRAWPGCTTDPRTASSAELCLVCVKSYDTEAVARMISPYLNESCLVTTVQNGLNNVERLAEVFGPERVIAGYTLQASTLTGLNSVYHAYDGETVLGLHPSTTTPVEKIKQVADELTSAGVKTKTVENVYPEALTKLIINSVINPLTAILGVRNGELQELQELSWIIDRLVEEGVEAASLLGARLKPEHVKRRVYEAIKATYENKSSMLQDIEKGRRTEIEFINGALARVLLTAGRPAPANTLLTQLVLAFERKGRRSW